MTGTSTATKSPSLKPAPITLAMRSSRSAWRQRLVDAERGAMYGIRGDGAFFVYFFLSSVTIVASFVLGISLVQWTIVILSLTLVLSAEMFNQVLKSLLSCIENPIEAPARAVLRIGTAAVFVAIAGSVIVIGLVFIQAALKMFGTH